MKRILIFILCALSVGIVSPLSTGASEYPPTSYSYDVDMQKNAKILRIVRKLEPAVLALVDQRIEQALSNIE